MQHPLHMLSYSPISIATVIMTRAARKYRAIKVEYAHSGPEAAITQKSPYGDHLLPGRLALVNAILFLFFWTELDNPIYLFR